jgi:DNA-binding NarL/FixJ family response regulator
VVILSAHTDVGRIRRALKAGVAGYVSKDVGGDIAVAVRAAGAGAKFFSAQILERAKDSGATGTG